MKTYMRLKNPFTYFFYLIIVLAVVLPSKSCKDDDDSSGLSTVKEISIGMSTDQEIDPVVRDRPETGTATLKLLSDSTLEYSLNVNNLDATDQLTVAHVHAGSLVDAGAPVITLLDNVTKKFSGNSASNSVKLNKTQYASIKENSNDFYVNVHSVKYPKGLVRGQLGSTITFAANIDLTPMSSVLRPETGLAILRLNSSDSTLYYKVTVSNFTSSDTLKEASVNVGASGVTGPVVIPLLNKAVDFNTEKSLKLSPSQMTFLTTSETYINVTSKDLPVELIRGQIR